MEIKNKINEKKINLNKNIIEQKDIRLSKYETIIEAVKDTDFYVNFDTDSTILVIAKDGKMFEFNMIGAIIWELLKKKSSYNEIENFLINLFEVDKTQIEKDIIFFINDLINYNILIIS